MRGIFWIDLFLNSKSEIGESPAILFLAFVIPAGACLTPEALILTGDWRGPRHWLADIAVAGRFVASAAVISFIFFMVLSAAIWMLVTIRRRWQNPRADLLDQLFSALWNIIKLRKNEEWTNPEARKGLVDCLEAAAKCLEVIPKRILGGDRFSSAWNQQQYLRRASGIRELKKWVLLPKAEAPDNLERELRRIIQLAAVGDWDGLPQADVPGDAPIPWWRRAFMIIRSLIIAALPALAVTVFGQSFLQIEILRNYVTGAAWIWALINLLAMLDPRFGEKLSAFKDLPSFLQVGGKSREP